jgi:hypothetical protein
MQLLSRCASTSTLPRGKFYQTFGRNRIDALRTADRELLELVAQDLAGCAARDGLVIEELDVSRALVAGEPPPAQVADVGG